MELKYRVGILGAGLGSRLNSNAGSKPLAKIAGKSLLELLLESFRKSGATEIYCALRNEQLSPSMREALPRPDGVSYIFKDTQSSLHTLAELILQMGTSKGPVLFTMADTVMLPGDFVRFLAFCNKLDPKDCAVLLTSFVDDENPLWARVSNEGLVTEFGSEPTSSITSGMYFLSPLAMEMALELVQGGTSKMRNFLAKLAERHVPVKSFEVTKTIDVDHPSDLEKAAAFLRDDEGSSS